MSSTTIWGFALLFGLLIALGIWLQISFAPGRARFLRIRRSTRATPWFQSGWGSKPLPYPVFWLALILSVTCFVVLLGPVWTREYNVDRAVFWSYVVIPVVVLAGAGRALRGQWGRLLAGMLQVAVWKFMITAGLVIAVWAVWSPARTTSAPIESPQPPPPDLRPFVEPGPWALEGSVQDGQGNPVSGVLVYVDSGLESARYAPPREPVRFILQGGRLQPSMGAVQIGQGLLLESENGRLHTLRAIQGSRQVFNFPYVGAVPIPAPRSPGLHALGCAVHPQEASVGLVILEHPFWAHTVEGDFRLEGLPEGFRGRLRARASLEGPTGSVEISGTTPVRLVLGQP